MRTLPEIELLLLCARPRLDADAVARLRDLQQQTLDWPLILRLALDYRTLPLLATHLRRHVGTLLSDDVRAALQTYHLDTTRHNLVLAMEVLRLLDLLAAQGIDAIPFKGPVSALLAFDDMAMRACGDIDLLVRQPDHDRAEQLLEQDGYQVTTRYQDAMQSGLWQEQREISVDLHWGIPPGKLQINSALLWSNLEPVVLLGRPVRTFSRYDTVLVTAINAVKEYWKPSLHHLTDIVALTDGYTDADWGTVFQRARDIGAERLLIAALLFAHRTLAMPLPASGPTTGSTDLFGHDGLARVVDELQEHLFPAADVQVREETMRLFHHGDMHVYYLTLTDSPWQRGRDWLAWACTPNSADRACVALPEALSFLYVFIRPLRLLLKRL